MLVLRELLTLLLLEGGRRKKEKRCGVWVLYNTPYVDMHVATYHHWQKGIDVPNLPRDSEIRLKSEVGHDEGVPRATLQFEERLVVVKQDIGCSKRNQRAKSYLLQWFITTKGVWEWTSGITIFRHGKFSQKIENSAWHNYFLSQITS